MTGIMRLWPEDRLKALWSLQRRARREGNRVTVKAYADGMMHTIKVRVGDNEMSFSTITEAVDWYDKQGRR